MNVFIRVDASIAIGTGHVMRCLTLAERLRGKGANVQFICREHPGHLCSLIESMGYQVLKLPAPPKKTIHFSSHKEWLGVSLLTDAKQTKELVKNEKIDLLIVDHYGIHADWESCFRSIAKKIMVIDDLADRRHDCDFLLDQNDLALELKRYHGLVPSHCKLFLGPNYALLRNEFFNLLPEKWIRSGHVKRIFIFFGGIDQTNETSKAIAAFLDLNRPDIEADVVIGQSNRYKHEIASLCRLHKNLHFHCEVRNIAEMMHQADLSIGAGGTTTWERLFLGLPSIVISIAANQEKICENLAKLKVIKYLGKREEVNTNRITSQLKKLIENEQERVDMSKRANLMFKDAPLHQAKMLNELMS
ncbi:UDP-2,4-diacetamido-2,4,6-trideoxy-beta-L-altropyranose hydrolase [Neobacillus sedimentimangrovi]|jgi:UDP-2,4-diacetamido-2,4,6-trideoxy-beta-L-altropyranose hydrolase|uniref:UDP-2,4-diacetamido-2,4, 6-trideoxy-beta-L-altropyranose hydrolase n=1 Tax=Neobacillus sedimentimangrovi TaxID=2699460 RepID=A0ABS8QFN1_9BACI|nr:UDP-2,4-diacetamido-2,4,6-trideoxy-beta-L-altropyranose hydrolase [Neobacillus sedimentimangrovi]MCD4837933.1 UDP-2,4-diacetamido-2,4,6-trideoxy-beta-L-altropyranose hydrolase [Neobacillus sedimentimangrovi]